jgi:hypothetical protein
LSSPKTRGRMINKDISDSKGFARLSPEACTLFCMMIPHYTSHGKMNGDPGFIKGEVCPRMPFLTLKNIPALLGEINENTSVKWFEHDGRRWIHSTNFLTEHQKLNSEKLGQDLLPNYSGLTQELVAPEVEVEVEVEGEGSEAQHAPVTNAEYIQQVKLHFNAMMDDPAQTSEWRGFYDGTFCVDDALFAACTWLVDNPECRKSRFRRFYGNWLRREFQKKTGGTHA